MSDITYSRRADGYLSAVDAVWGCDGEKARVNATLAVAKAVREVDEKLKHCAKLIVDALPKDPGERWLTWERDGQHEAIAVRHIVRFVENSTGSTLVVTTEDDYIVPVSFGTVALTVGA